MQGRNLLSSCLFIKAADAASSDTSTITGSTIDTACFDGVVAEVQCSVANAGNYLYWQEGDAADLSDAADVDGSKLICTASNQKLISEIHKPRKRYLRPMVVRGSAAVTSTLDVIAYGAKNPSGIANTRTGYVAEALVSPADGGDI